MSLLGFFKGSGENGFGYDSTTADVTAGLDLTGRTILVTGCNAGLGQETLRALCARGARVIGAARTLDKALRHAVWCQARRCLLRVIFPNRSQCVLPWRA